MEDFLGEHAVIDKVIRHPGWHDSFKQTLCQLSQ
jgi:hypothetical protein